jgi:peptidoglycan/LPS O-acetylase OafA/YrhL
MSNFETQRTVSTGIAYEPVLDGVRAVAILLVLLGHASEKWGSPPLGFVMGDAGVAVFFVLSGFLITGTMLADEKRHRHFSVRRFFVKRVFRIFPAFYVFLGSMAFLDWLGAIQRSPMNTYLASALYVRNLLGTGWITGHLWSLSLEEQFYLLWPVIFVLAGKHRDIATVSLVALTLLWRVWHTVHFGIVNYGAFYRPDLRMDTLLVGCYTALRPPAFRISPKICVGAALLVPVSTVLLTFKPWAMAITPFAHSCLIAITIVGLVQNRGFVICRLLVTKPFVIVGRLSYSLYLWQQPFFSPEITNNTTFWFVRLFLLPLVAGVSYRFIETPALDVRNRVLATRTFRLASSPAK